MEVDDKIKMMGKPTDPPKIVVCDEVKRHAEKLHIQDNDVVLLRGSWDSDMVEQMAIHLSDLEVKALLVVLPNKGMDFTSMPIKDFYHLMKVCEEQMGCNSEVVISTDGVSGD